MITAVDPGPAATTDAGGFDRQPFDIVETLDPGGVQAELVDDRGADGAVRHRDVGRAGRAAPRAGER